MNYTHEPSTDFLFASQSYRAPPWCECLIKQTGMRIIILVLFAAILVQLNAQEETKTPTFDFIASSSQGDLNKDGILDLVIVTQDTVSNFGPYRLEIFFTQVNGDKKLILQSDQAIDVAYPDGKDGWLYGNDFEQVTIHNGVLWIEVGFLRGHMEHKFRYQNDHFELIGYSCANVSSGHLTTIDYNLSTGQRIEKKCRIDQDLKLVSDAIIKLNPLPSLEDFTPYTNEHY
ncbi:MAG: hypothetical protein COA38_01550 [Fluviicola sp.]|nr:MAG: hypothetical protein COA38_01550 [Fluviicola sp.]